MSPRQCRIGTRGCRSSKLSVESLVRSDLDNLDIVKMCPYLLIGCWYLETIKTIWTLSKCVQNIGG